MSKRGNIESLKDIEVAIRRIETYIVKMDFKKFLEDIKTQDAVIRNLEIIGEAAKNISNDLKISYKDIEWKKIAGMRDKMIHFYFGVNWDIVWRTIKNKLPDLKEKIERIVKEIEEDEKNE